jgi:hypothetical protein
VVAGRANGLTIEQIAAGKYRPQVIANVLQRARERWGGVSNSQLMALSAALGEIRWDAGEFRPAGG